MKHIRLLNALKKANIPVLITEGNRFSSINDTREITWFINPDQDDEVHCLKCKTVGQKDQPEIDYFVGFYIEKIKSAISYLTKTNGWK